MPPPIRHQTLLDALEAIAPARFQKEVFRSVREGREADLCHQSGGRWDDGSFEVLYTSLDRQGAIAERQFHLFRGQPFPPSKVRYKLYSIEVSLRMVMQFPNLDALQAVGLNTQKFGQVAYLDREQEYPQSQQIAETAHFLGADGIRVPGARHNSDNLVIFCDQYPRPQIGPPTDLGLIEW